MSLPWKALAGIFALAALLAAPARASDPDAPAKALGQAFKSLCLDSGLSLERLRTAWASLAKDAPLAERAIDGVSSDPQARPGAPKVSPAPSGPARVRLDGKLVLEGASYEIAVIVPKGEDRLDACRLEASVEGIDGVIETVVTSLGLAEPKIIAASQSSTYLNDPDPTIFKYQTYSPIGPITVTLGLEFKPHGRGNLLLIAEPAGR